jgi:hypothetical protein
MSAVDLIVLNGVTGYWVETFNEPWPCAGCKTLAFVSSATGALCTVMTS